MMAMVLDFSEDAKTRVEDSGRFFEQESKYFM